MKYYPTAILLSVLLSTSVFTAAATSDQNVSPNRIQSLAQSNITVLDSNSPIQKVSTSKRIKRKHLKKFIDQFSLLYEEGDLKNFMQLFASNAETNDASDSFSIEKNYTKLFKSTEMRVIDLQGLNWNISRKSAKGKGDFLVTVLHQGGEKMKRYSGKISLEIKNNHGSLQLTKFFHAYSEE